MANLGPETEPPFEGPLGARLRAAITRGIRMCGLPRTEVARQLGERVGFPVTRIMVDGWTRDSGKRSRIPAEVAPALAEIIGCPELVHLLLSQEQRRWLKIGELVEQSHAGRRKGAA